MFGEDLHEENLNLYSMEPYGKSIDKYCEKRNENSSLLWLYDWSAVAQIDEDKFCVVMENDVEKICRGKAITNLDLLL